MKPFFVRVRFEPGLTVKRGRLLTGGESGSEVHAAAFLKQRLVILDRELLANPRELRRIWMHELYHFVWWRMRPGARVSWERLLASEIVRRAPGELGWSAEWRKQALRAADRRNRTRKWREYCCESFCDSAAWLSTGRPRHNEVTLPRPHRQRRAEWLREHIYNDGRSST